MSDIIYQYIGKTKNRDFVFVHVKKLHRYSKPMYKHILNALEKFKEEEDPEPNLFYNIDDAINQVKQLLLYR